MSVQSEPNPGTPNLGRVGEVESAQSVITYIDEHPADTVTYDATSRWERPAGRYLVWFEVPD